MSVIDYERAWVELKAYVVDRNSHGQRDLLREMTRIEVENRVPEGERDFTDGPIPLRAQAPRSGLARVGEA